MGNHLFVIFAVLDESFAVNSCLNRSFFLHLSYHKRSKRCCSVCANSDEDTEPLKVIISGLTLTDAYSIRKMVSCTVRKSTLGFLNRYHYIFYVLLDTANNIVCRSLYYIKWNTDLVLMILVRCGVLHWAVKLLCCRQFGTFLLFLKCRNIVCRSLYYIKCNIDLVLMILVRCEVLHWAVGLLCCRQFGTFFTVS